MCINVSSAKTSCTACRAAVLLESAVMYEFVEFGFTLVRNVIYNLVVETQFSIVKQLL